MVDVSTRALYQRFIAASLSIPASKLIKEKLHDQNEKQDKNLTINSHYTQELSTHVLFTYHAYYIRHIEHGSTTSYFPVPNHENNDRMMTEYIKLSTMSYNETHTGIRILLRVLTLYRFA